jgi:hypothetical protein
MFSNISRTALAATAFALLSFGSANAGSINTPIIYQGGGDQLVCIANNVQNTAVTVTVRIVGLINNAQQTCTLPVGDREGCSTFKNNTSGHCQIIINGLTNAEVAQRVRGVMFSRKITAPFTMEGTVQAQ